MNEIAPRRDAGFWKREVAYLLDALLLGAVLNVLLSIPLAVMGVLGGDELLALLGAALATLSGGAPQEVEALAWSLLSLLGWILAVSTAGYVVLAWPYFALLESSSRQASLGKLALGIRVVDCAGARIGFGRASARFFAAALSWASLNLGHALAAWTPQKRALHDYLAGTRVENVDPTQPQLPGWAQALVWLQAALMLAGVLVLGVLLAALLVGGAASV